MDFEDQPFAAASIGQPSRYAIIAINISYKESGMGFLNGDENYIMLEAHKLGSFCLGELYISYEPYDFKSSKITLRISGYRSVFLKHQLTPPPEEI